MMHVFMLQIKAKNKGILGIIPKCKLVLYI